MSSKPKLKSQDRGTVLLRQAEPKYSFVGRKLPKEGGQEPKQNSKSKSDHKPRTSFQNNSSLSSSLAKKPIAVVEGSCQAASNNGSTQSTPGMAIATSGDPRNQSVDSRTKIISETSGQDVPSNAGKDSHTLLPGDSTSIPSPAATMAPASNIPPHAVIEDTAAALALSNITNSLSVAERFKELEKEKELLKKDLDVQLQVNAELKRLLVASVGEDLGERVQRLVRDRAQLSFDIGGFSKKMREDYEHLDKVSIQADMWRSKYLASRVMIEELGNARAFYSLQCHDAQDALQQMLNERHELRTNLLDTHKVLQQVKGAFDPLNSHRSSSLPSTNVLDLSRSCQQLAEAVRFRLLPAHITTAMSLEIDLDSWENSVTRAEQYAHELLSRPSEPPGSLQSGSSHLLPIAGGSLPQNSSQLVNRFHPHVRDDNLTFTCCKCKGEISVI